MENTKLMIKGFFIGIGKIIPGVSGSLIAITLGVYDKLLNAVSNFFKNMKENIKFLIPIGIGILCAIILTSKLFSYLLVNYYIMMMLFFVGLIVGGIPTQLKKIKFSKNIIFSLISFFLVIFLCFMKIDNSDGINNYSFFIFFLIGLLDATTMVIPGISGTAIMMLLGCYNTVLNMFSNIYLFDYLKQSIPFFMGVGIGIIIISKIISFCLKKYNEQTNYAIIGFTLSSVLLLIIEIIGEKGQAINYIIGIFLFLIGYKLVSAIEK